MTRVSALALIAAVAAAGIITPAFAQSSANPPSVTPAVSHQAKVRARHNGRQLYNMIPQNSSVRNSDDPALTGGGSIGYNQMIYNW